MHVKLKSSPRKIEFAVAAHVSAFVVGVSWAFGGNADWVRTPISIWGSLGILLTLAVVSSRGIRSRIIEGTSIWIWPIILLNLIVGVSCLTPGFHTAVFRGQELIMPAEVSWWIPSTTRVRLTLPALWLFDGIYFSCLNVALVIRNRRIIRMILAVVVGNALALSIFGIAQKAVGSSGIYFGSVESPQSQFFASFVYDNHWGAFIVIVMGACVGLVLRYAYGEHGEGFFYGPAFTGSVAAVVMAISIPFSGSRACTLLLGVLACIALVRGFPSISKAMRHSGFSTAGVAVVTATSSVLAVWCVWMVAGDVIQARAEKTREQVAEMWIRGGVGSRSVLYQDTIRMASARPLFGWGMGSYPVVFSLFNTQESKVDRLPVIYHDAHSDWLQAYAELGLAGAALVGAAVALPAFSLRRQRFTDIPFFLLVGCMLVAAYAWIEFPFGNVAVVLTWWLCFFSAIQYARLTGRSPDVL
jgi:O-antigen ligase